MKATGKISLVMIMLLSVFSSLNGFFDKRFRVLGNQTANCVIPTINGFVLVGSTDNQTGGDKDVLFIKTDFNGIKQHLFCKFL